MKKKWQEICEKRNVFTFWKQKRWEKKDNGDDYGHFQRQNFRKVQKTVLFLEYFYDD